MAHARRIHWHHRGVQPARCRYRCGDRRADHRHERAGPRSRPGAARIARRGYPWRRRAEAVAARQGALRRYLAADPPLPAAHLDVAGQGAVTHAELVAKAATPRLRPPTPEVPMPERRAGPKAPEPQRILGNQVMQRTAGTLYRCAGMAATDPPIQAKLKVTSVDDPLE